MTHSRMGIASFVTSLGVWILLVMCALEIWWGTFSYGEAFTVLFFVGFVYSFPVQLVSLGLGIGGLAQRKEKKMLAIWGTLLSSVYLILAVYAFMNQ